MKKVKLIVFVLVILSAQAVWGKTPGNYKTHHQITDKEILFETTKGIKILISACGDYEIGVTVYPKGDAVSLISPEMIRSKAISLKGSIYVEEIHDAIQVTTTMADGLYIRIEKNPFRLSYVQKDSDSALASEYKGFEFDKNSTKVSFSVNGNNEQFEVVGLKNLLNPSSFIEKGEVIEIEDQGFALISTRGYSLAFDCNSKKTISLNKKNELFIQSMNNMKDGFGYMLLFGPSHHDLLGKIALAGIGSIPTNSLF